MTAKTLAVLIASSLLLAGCGNKGPLVLPPAQTPALEDPRPVPDPDALPEVAPEADTGVDAIEPDDVPADPPTVPAAR